MSTPIESLPRRVIPRWRDFRTAAELGEFSPHQSIVVPDDITSGVESLLAIWKSGRNDKIAGELLSASWLEGAHDLTIETAMYLLRNGSSAPEATKNLAQHIVDGIRAEPTASPGNIILPLDRHAIQSIRSALRLNPYDAIGWCELARYYAIIGKLEKAKRAIRTAVSLAPDSRYILRSAARCFIHLGDAEAALRVLSETGRTSNDPWLLAAHVSIANILDKPPRFYKRAKELSKSVSLSSFHTSELNAALGTLELFAGNDKAAKRMLISSLHDPTENVTAQAWWAKSQLKIALNPDLLELPRSFESNTRALVLTENWQGAIKAAEQWLEDEPFSSSPAIELSFILSLAFEEYDQAKKVLERARRSNPEDLLILNNLAFSLASLGKPQEASELLASVDLENAPTDRLVALTATAGLVHFREGNIIEGRRHYEAAVQLAKKHQLNRQAALATVYWAKEEKRAFTSESVRALEEAEKYGQTYKDPLFRLVMESLRKTVPADKL